LTLAEHLLASGYKDPAAMLIGAVLEEGLRRIARREDVTLRMKDDVGSLGTRTPSAERLEELKRRLRENLRAR
jgi:hypothetical protein